MSKIEGFHCIYFEVFINFVHSDVKPRRPRAQTGVDVKALAQVLEAKGEFIIICGH